MPAKPKTIHHNKWLLPRHIAAYVRAGYQNITVPPSTYHHFLKYHNPYNGFTQTRACRITNNAFQYMNYPILIINNHNTARGRQTLSPVVISRIQALRLQGWPYTKIAQALHISYGVTHKYGGYVINT